MNQLREKNRARRRTGAKKIWRSNLKFQIWNFEFNSFAAWRLCASFCLLLVLLNGISLADPPPDPTHDQRRILAELSSADPKAVAAEIAELKITITTDPGFVIGMMRGPVIRTLIEHRHFQEAAELATLGICWNLNDLGSIQQLQQLLIEALFKARKPTEALGAGQGPVQRLLAARYRADVAGPGRDDQPCAPGRSQRRPAAGRFGNGRGGRQGRKLADRQPSRARAAADPAFTDKAYEHRPGSYLIPTDDWRAIDAHVNLLLLLTSRPRR